MTRRSWYIAGLQAKPKRGSKSQRSIGVMYFDAPPRPAYWKGATRNEVSVVLVPGNVIGVVSGNGCARSGRNAPCRLFFSVRGNCNP